MSLPITCSTLSQKDFDTMTNSWKAMVDSADRDAGIRASLTSTVPALSNYAYLSKDYVNQLLANSATVAIRTKFVLTSDATPSFSLAAYGITAQGVPTTPYFLMGVAAVPASIKNVMSLLEVDEQIPAAQAAAWIMNWNNLTPESLTAAPFTSSAGMLLGYTFPVSDFQDPWPASPGGDAALWLNFDMHAPDFIPPISPEQLLFSTIVTLNKVPNGTTPGTIVLAPNLRYYDVSRPCPPYCDTYP
jgi:hypothetical protein